MTKDDIVCYGVLLILLTVMGVIYNWLVGTTFADHDMTQTIVLAGMVTIIRAVRATRAGS